MNARKLLMLGLVSLALSACGGRQATQPVTPGGQAGQTAGGTERGTGAGLGTGGRLGEMEELTPEERAAQAEQELMSQLTVFFDFDQSDIRSDFTEMLVGHGRYLADNPGARVRLEGHADERGSREYNIGLGERRAQSVRRVLLLQGASADQITTVSYGEERPAVLGSDEEAYAMNRRVELVYR